MFYYNVVHHPFQGKKKKSLCVWESLLSQWTDVGETPPLRVAIGRIRRSDSRRRSRNPQRRRSFLTPIGRTVFNRQKSSLQIQSLTFRDADPHRLNVIRIRSSNIDHRLTSALSHYPSVICPPRAAAWLEAIPDDILLETGGGGTPSLVNHRADTSTLTFTLTGNLESPINPNMHVSLDRGGKTETSPNRRRGERAHVLASAPRAACMMWHIKPGKVHIFKSPK